MLIVVSLVSFLRIGLLPGIDTCQEDLVL